MPSAGLQAGETTALARADALVHGDLVLIAGLRVAIQENRRWVPGQVLIITSHGVRLMRAGDDRMTRILSS